jgi:DNA-binding NtrC family response regulator
MAVTRVLIIEDNADVADLLAVLLGDEGHAVTCVAAPCAGLALARSRPWDACLTEAFSTVEAAAVRACLTDLAGCCPVVLISGHGWARSARAADLGVAALLAKPFELDDVLAGLAAAAASPRRESPRDGLEPPASA